MIKFCAKCGKEIKPGDLFCANCGWKVPKDNVTEIAHESSTDLEKKLNSSNQKMIDETAGLLTRMQNGDSEAFQQLFEKTKRYVFYIVSEIIGAKNSDVEDVMQEVYLNIYSKMDTLKDPALSLKWIKMIARNKAIDYCKKANVKHEMLSEEKDEIADSEDVLIQPMMVPEDIMENQATRQLVSDIIAALPQDQKRIVVQYYFNECKLSEIAEEMGIPLNTVKTKLRRIKQSLEEKFLLLEREQGVRLHSIGVVPFMLYLFTEQAEAAIVPEALSQSLCGKIFESDLLKYLMKRQMPPNPANGGAAGAASQTAPPTGQTALNPTGNAVGQAAENASMNGAAQSAAQMTGNGMIKITGVKIAAAAVTVLALAGAGFGIFSLTQKAQDQEPKKEMTLAADNTEIAVTDGAGKEGTDVSSDAENADTAEKGKETETGTKDSTDAEKPYDTPVAYEMTEAEENNLKEVLRQLYEQQSANEPIGNVESGATYYVEGARLTYDVSEPLFNGEYAKEFFIYDIMNETQFFGQTGYMESGTKFSLEEVNEMLDRLIGEKIEDPVDVGTIFLYEDGYFTFLGSDAPYTYSSHCEIDNMMQISDTQIEVYGQLYINTCGQVDPTDYDNPDIYFIPYSPANTFQALIKLNADSPSGVTVEGIAYDAKNPYGEAAIGDAENMILKSSVEELTEEDLKGFTKEQLRIARNEIYARHGRKFQSEDLQNYFENFWWYWEVYDTDHEIGDEDLNPIELKNVYFISEYENKL